MSAVCNRFGDDPRPPLAQHIELPRVPERFRESAWAMFAASSRVRWQGHHALSNARAKVAGAIDDIRWGAHFRSAHVHDIAIRYAFDVQDAANAYAIADTVAEAAREAF